MKHAAGGENGGARPAARDAVPVADRLARFTHTLDALRGAAEGADLERRWVRVSAIRGALRALDGRALASDVARELARVRAASEALAEEVEARLRPEVAAELTTWLGLTSARRAAERRLAEARAALADVVGTRSRHVRAHFALDMPVAVAGSPGLADVARDPSALAAALASLDERLAAARAACPPAPPASFAQALSDLKGAAPIEFAEVAGALARDEAGARRDADVARKVLEATPSAGAGPLFTDAEDLPFHGALRVLSVYVLPVLAIVLVPLSVLLEGSWSRLFVLGLGQRLLLACVFGAIAIRVGFVVADKLIRARYQAWERLAKPIDRARIQVLWHYLVARGRVEQLEDERAALVELDEASRALTEFDAAPDRGGRLTALRAERPELAVQVDLASQEVAAGPAPASR